MTDACGHALSATQFELLSDDGALALILYRLRELKRAGCDDALCVLLAGRADIDLDRATGLIARGCRPELVLRILA